MNCPNKIYIGWQLLWWHFHLSFTMRLKEFIRQNRQAIDDVINQVIYRHDGKGGKGIIPNPPPKYNNAGRHEWIMNEEGLYLAAKEAGCKI